MIPVERKRAAGALAIILACLQFSSCVPSVMGPDRAFPASDEADYIRDQLGMPNLKKYYDQDAIGRAYYRNEYVLARMAYIDIEYNKYERELTTERQGVDFLSTMAINGLTTAGALVSSGGTKTVLSEVTGLVNGGQSAFNEKVQFKQTLNIFVNQMRSNRAIVAKRILKKLNSSADQYPFLMALSELEEYYQAGTLTGAISAATQESAVKAKEEESAVAVEKERLTIIQGETAETRDLTYVRFFYCDKDGTVAQDEEARLIKRAGEIAGPEFGKLDTTRWTLLDELSLGQLRGKTTIIADFDHAEKQDAEKLQALLDGVANMRPVVLVKNSGPLTEWALSVIVCK